MLAKLEECQKWQIAKEEATRPNFDFTTIINHHITQLQGNYKATIGEN
jgi:hypothetical protein